MQMWNTAYYLKIIAIWKSPVLLLQPLQNVGTDSFCCQKKQWIINLNGTLIVLNMLGILEISILFIQWNNMQVFLCETDKIWSIRTDLRHVIYNRGW